jgi:hypothetical protein
MSVDEIALEISASFVEMLFLMSLAIWLGRIELYLHNIVSTDHRFGISEPSYAQCRNAYY